MSCYQLCIIIIFIFIIIIIIIYLYATKYIYFLNITGSMI